MSTSGERLRKARIAAGFDSAADAAKALDVPYPTYAAHENGSRGFGGNIDLYARRFAVRGEWLRSGYGPMKPGMKTEVQELFDAIAAEKQAEALRYLRFLKAG